MRKEIIEDSITDEKSVQKVSLVSGGEEGNVNTVEGCDNHNIMVTYDKNALTQGGPLLCFPR